PPDAPSSPSLIILATWADAASKHIAKYISYYHTTYPSARILLLRSDLLELLNNMLLRSDTSAYASVSPAVNIIKDTVTVKPDAGILLHLFSNGGALKTCLLASAYRTRFQDPLPVDATVLDSSPGSGEFWATADAMLLSLPQSLVIYYPLVALVYLLLSLLSFLGWARNRENPVVLMRKQLFHDTMFPRWKPRLYCYSVADPMVEWIDVELHAAEGKLKKWGSRLEKFERSGHANHIGPEGDKERYWGAVKDIW
ncbi:hypothetical protein M501DRAFT_914936, partial [Patellaria atrata CBS 101060]